MTSQCVLPLDEQHALADRILALHHAGRSGEAISLLSPRLPRGSQELALAETACLYSVFTHGQSLVDAVATHLPPGQVLVPLDPLAPLPAECHAFGFWHRLVTEGRRDGSSLWREILIRHLDALGTALERVRALLVTFDWFEPMEDLVLEARDRGWATVALLHESVFTSEQRWYVNPRTGGNVPQADHCLVWGERQRRILTARGYPAERVHMVGAIKLDACATYRPALSRVAFTARFGLDPTRPIVLVALQVMDEYGEGQGLALEAQRAMCRDVIAAGERVDHQVILRCPVALSHLVLSPEHVAEFSAHPGCAVDGATGEREFESHFVASAHETLWHADVVVSYNSTMLLEAEVMGRAGITYDNRGVLSSWHLEGGMPVARSADDLVRLLPRLGGRGGSMTQAGRLWAWDEFAGGRIDGRSAERAALAISGVLSSGQPLS
jgi:hypothetical protein